MKLEDNIGCIMYVIIIVISIILSIVIFKAIWNADIPMMWKILLLR